MDKLPNELKFSIFSFLLPDKLDETSKIIELANDSLFNEFIINTKKNNIFL